MLSLSDKQCLVRIDLDTDKRQFLPAKHASQIPHPLPMASHSYYPPGHDANQPMAAPRPRHPYDTQSELSMALDDRSTSLIYIDLWQR